MKITGKTRLSGLFAHPAKQSLSPIVHNAAFEHLGISAVYLAFDFEEEEVGKSVEMIRTWDMLGVNVSMPYKASVIPYLDELSEEAELMGAVNTIVNKNGRLIGKNTDGLGFLRAAEEMGVKLKDECLTVLGAGGAAQAIITQAALFGVKELFIVARSGKSYSEMERKIEKLSERTATKLRISTFSDENYLKNALDKSVLLVNATSVGMNEDISPIDLHHFSPKNIAVMDIIYKPLETTLLKAARELNLNAVNGLPMLLYQAERAFYEWTGQELPIELVKEKIEQEI
ncbi:shikimate dehydrogenase [Pilibacter termitis]|uniref:Shikimate dehydrogenase (NADP(+)) n=1 Tax=Pilibacter termitis TaxID=263852 RepID=A0A1T4NTF9_9ENTE|nr:shikimate dehydrogenase [Pilibacter termitis]SJZ81998.1 shikimate dehydrogenase [Pilibacter termitis]